MKINLKKISLHFSLLVLTFGLLNVTVPADISQADYESDSSVVKEGTDLPVVTDSRDVQIAVSNLGTECEFSWKSINQLLSSWCGDLSVRTHPLNQDTKVVVKDSPDFGYYSISVLRTAGPNYEPPKSLGGASNSKTDATLWGVELLNQVNGSSQISNDYQLAQITVVVSDHQNLQGVVMRC